MATHFCPKCWYEIEPDAAKCRSCGYDTAEYSRLPYEQKLLLALSHPIQDNRLLAVQLLGELKSSAAVLYFKTMLNDEDDYYLLREVLIALGKVASTERRAILQRATKHRSRIVRNFAKLIIDGSAR
jgi:HEAT repeat protein